MANNHAVVNALDRLIAVFSKLPGIGKKSAGRIVYHILDSNPALALNLAKELEGLHHAIHRCGNCGGFTETDPCAVCSDSGRDHSVICVIESAQDMRIIEDAREFRGVYHVLGGLIAPLEGISPADLSIDKLINRLEKGGIKELILALNPTIEGDTTALYLQKQLKNFQLEITRLASGMPVGGNIEYIDKLTLSRSFRGRIRV
ncbi:MAG: recombination mediator RecR [Treponema sp.]|nr:recombination mediator RecR [Treponema sp.]MCL2272581.1 recombination mediator RecR [Treponema sp.]